MSKWIKFILGWLAMSACLATAIDLMRPGVAASLVIGMICGYGYLIAVSKWTDWLQ